MNTQIRPAKPADIEELIALSRRTISACYRTFLGDQSVDDFLHCGAVEQYVPDNIASCSVLVLDGAIAGHVVSRDHLIDLMMIDHVLHRRGHGSRLLGHVQEQLFREFKELTLESFEGNRQANSFYAKHGWREASRYLDPASAAVKIVFRKP